MAAAAAAANDKGEGGLLQWNGKQGQWVFYVVQAAVYLGIVAICLTLLLLPIPKAAKISTIVVGAMLLLGACMVFLLSYRQHQKAEQAKLLLAVHQQLLPKVAGEEQQQEQEQEQEQDLPAQGQKEKEEDQPQQPPAASAPYSYHNGREGITITAPFVGKANQGEGSIAGLESMEVPGPAEGVQFAPPASGRPMPPTHPLHPSQIQARREAGELEPLLLGKAGQASGAPSGEQFAFAAPGTGFNSATIDPDLIADPYLGDGINPVPGMELVNPNVLPQLKHQQQLQVEYDQQQQQQQQQPLEEAGNNQGRWQRPLSQGEPKPYTGQLEFLKRASQKMEDDFQSRNGQERIQEWRNTLMRQEDPHQQAAATANGFTQRVNLARQFTNMKRDPSVVDPPGFIPEGLGLDKLANAPPPVPLALPS